MFEKEIESFQKIVQDNTIGNTPSIALKHILESNIPSNAKSFFKAEIESLLFQERKHEVRSLKFAYHQEDIVLLQDQMDTLLVYHYTYSEKEFFDALDRCIHFLFNFLCRPLWTLENFLYEENNTLPIYDLNLKFRFCADYNYYWSILEQYLLSKKKTELTKDEAMHLLHKIDAELIKNHSAVEVAKMTEPFFDFVGYIQQHTERNSQQGIPVKALVYFFEDKRLNSVAQHLLKIREKGKYFLQYAELIDILKDTFVKKGFSVEEEVAKLTQTQYSKSNGILLSFLESEKRAIVKLVFKNDEAHYNSVVESITSSISWDDAALSLDHFFTMNDVDPFSREAILFTNALQSYFSNQQSKDSI
ncbi:MAG: hypothetical protein PHP42_11170 [Bacteroidota bacterium]|nr:hypothetical protein [Bacteroidota bacterium]